MSQVRDEVLDEIIEKLDSFARDYDKHEFGLPIEGHEITLSSDRSRYVSTREEMRNIVREVLKRHCCEQIF